MGKKRKKRRKPGTGISQRLERRIAATIQTWEQGRVYEAQISVSPMAARITELRLAGQQLEQNGDLAGALAHLEAAQRLIKTSDQGAAAASATYQLAETLLNSGIGVKRDTLLRALELSKRTLLSRARRRSPTHHAKSHDQLGRIHRALASVTSTTTERFGLAEVSYRQSLATLRGRGLWAELDAAGTYSNWGNMEAERGNFDRAVSLQRRAVDGYERALIALPHLPPGLGSFLETEFRQTALRARSNLAGALLGRGSHGSAAEALALLKPVLTQIEATNRLFAEASWHAADALHALSETAKAVDALSAVNWKALDPAYRMLHAMKLRRLGQATGQAVMTIATAGYSQASEARNAAASDHVASHFAMQMQQFAALHAEAAMLSGHSGFAFLHLASSMGRRYSDFLRNATWDLRDSVVAELQARRAAHSLVCDNFDELVHVLPYTEPSTRRSLIQSLASEVRVEPRFDMANVEGVGDPTAAIRAFARVHAETAIGAFKALLERQAELGLPFGFDDDHRAFLHRFDDHVFVVARLREPGLILVAWAGDADVHARSAQVQLEAGMLEGLEEGKPTRSILEVVGRALENTLPGDAKSRHLVLVASLVSLRIPWAAVPFEDTHLVECVRSIAIAPSLGAYRVRRAPRPPRAGTLLVAPGDALASPTFGHERAFQERRGLRVLEGASATSDEIRAVAQDADVVAFYSHGGHEEGRFWLELSDGRADARLFGDPTLWDGAERVELWACKSGWNEPFSGLMPPSDDLYGLDAELHYYGVRTTIGTLWPVPDGTTSLIARQYGVALSAGLSSVEALASAQRWYLSEFLPQVRQAPDEAAVIDLLQDLGLPAEGMLSEASSEREAVVSSLTEPRAWAGFRFIGVPENKPEETWVSPPPLTGAQRAWIEQRLSRD